MRSCYLMAVLPSARDCNVDPQKKRDTNKYTKNNNKNSVLCIFGVWGFKNVTVENVPHQKSKNGWEKKQNPPKILLKSKYAKKGGGKDMFVIFPTPPSVKIVKINTNLHLQI